MGISHVCKLKEKVKVKKSGTLNSEATGEFIAPWICVDALAPRLFSQATLQVQHKPML